MPNRFIWYTLSLQVWKINLMIVISDFKDNVFLCVKKYEFDISVFPLSSTEYSWDLRLPWKKWMNLAWECSFSSVLQRNTHSPQTAILPWVGLFSSLFDVCWRILGKDPFVVSRYIGRCPCSLRLFCATQRRNDFLMPLSIVGRRYSYMYSVSVAVTGFAASLGHLFRTILIPILYCPHVLCPVSKQTHVYMSMRSEGSGAPNSPYCNARAKFNIERGTKL